MALDAIGHLFGIICDLDEIEIFWQDAVLLQHLLFHPIQKTRPIVFSHQIDGKGMDFFRLNESQRFKKFIHCPKSSRQKDIALRIADEHHLADKEIAELQTIFGVYVAVWLHFKRQVDRQPTRTAVCRLSAPVRTLHQAGAATRDDCKSPLSDMLGHINREVVVRACWFKAGRAKNGDGRAEICHCIESVYKF